MDGQQGLPMSEAATKGDIFVTATGMAGVIGIEHMYAMKDGALGLSTSLQYVPARFAKTDEIVELAKVARQYGGIYATHQRSEANAIDDSMKEVFEIARRAQIPAEIWHFKTAYKKNWGRMPEMLRLIEEARRQGDRRGTRPATSCRHTCRSPLGLRPFRS